MIAPVRLALVGCGRIAQVAHLPAVEKARGVQLVALSDPSESVVHSVARRYDVPYACTDAAQLWSDTNVEAVLIAAPDRFHSSLSSAALGAGKHVLVEKPLASSSAEAEGVVDLVRLTGLKLQVGAMKRHDAGLQAAHRFVNASLGEPRSFSAWYLIGDLRNGVEATLFPRVFAESEAHRYEATFKADRERYLLTTHGAHIFDTIRFLLGDVESIQARHRGYGRDHAWSALVTLRCGAVGTLTIAVDVPGLSAEGIEIFGSSGSIHVDTPFPFYRQASHVRAYTRGQEIVPVLTEGDAYQRQVEAFARAIREDLPPTPDAHDGLAALELIEATAQSAETGQEIAL